VTEYDLPSGSSTQGEILMDLVSNLSDATTPTVNSDLAVVKQSYQNETTSALCNGAFSDASHDASPSCSIKPPDGALADPVELMHTTVLLTEPHSSKRQRQNSSSDFACVDHPQDENLSSGRISEYGSESHSSEATTLNSTVSTEAPLDACSSHNTQPVTAMVTSKDQSLPLAPVEFKEPHPEDTPTNSTTSLAPAIDRFKDLIEVLTSCAAKGVHRPHRTNVAFLIGQKHPLVYTRSGCKDWMDYASQAARAGIIQLGGQGGSAWISSQKPGEAPSMIAPVPPPFEPLVKILREYKSEGDSKPSRSLVRDRLVREDASIFKRNGFSSWAQYAKAARESGIVILLPNCRIIELKREWWEEETS
jgi:hypothetical protein